MAIFLPAIHNVDVLGMVEFAYFFLSLCACELFCMYLDVCTNLVKIQVLLHMRIVMHELVNQIELVNCQLLIYATTSIY